jgi:hypothetical protein
MERPMATPTDLDLRELSALADGTLAADRRAAVQARIAASPELQAAYERERAVVAALHEARAVDRAPEALRARIQASRPGPAVIARRRVGYFGALAAGLAAVVLAVALALPGGGPGALSIDQATALGLRGANASAPGVDPRHPQTRLKLTVGPAYFPNWKGQFGWTAVGRRTDRVSGRTVETVYYTWQGHQIAYTIVGGPELKWPAAPATHVGGIEFRTFQLHGHPVVTWRRDGHTCVLSGVGPGVSDLEMLAVHDDDGQ